MYKFFVRTYVLSAFTTYVQLEKAAKMTFVQKTHAFNIDEIDTWMIRSRKSNFSQASLVTFRREIVLRPENDRKKFLFRFFSVIFLVLCIWAYALSHIIFGQIDNFNGKFIIK